MTDTSAARAAAPTTWDNDEDVDYLVIAEHWDQGSGPQGTWTAHERPGLKCSVHGRLASYPPANELLDVVLDAEHHHHDYHEGACYDWCGPGLTRCGRDLLIAAQEIAKLRKDNDGQR